jgi:hypothetical protein
MDDPKNLDHIPKIEEQKKCIEEFAATLRRNAPKRQSSTRFELKTPISEPISIPIPKPIPTPIPKSIPTPIPKSIPIPISTLEPKLPLKSSLKSSLKKSSLKLFEPSLHTSFELSSPTLSKSMRDESTDPCTQYNFFYIRNLSCYIDSLLFSLLHKFENNFILELKQKLELVPKQKHNECKINVIKFIVSFYNQIHDKSQSEKILNSGPFRELLYKCDLQRQTRDIPREFYTSSEQDPHDFFGKILNIIDKSQNKITILKNYTEPIGNRDLIENFRTYSSPEVEQYAYNIVLIYTQSLTSPTIDIGFEQIDRNTFKFSTPSENVEFERATEDYPEIVDFIYENNLIDSNLKKKIKTSHPGLFNFFNDETTKEMRYKLYKLMRNEHTMIYSEEESKVITHYTYRDDLPKLSFTKSTHTTVFKNPVNYFIISIVRETDSLHRNTKFLENLPERIHSYSKTLELVSAIVHYGANLSHGHYVCYFKCGNNWYIMDNTKQNIRNYAPFDIRNREIITRCRMLVYM